MITKEIARKTEEIQRLIQTIDFYSWLEDWGLLWCDIAAISAPIPAIPSIRNMVKQTAIAMGKSDSIGTYDKAISYKLKDGRVIVIPFPPFAHNVVYNKPDASKDWRKPDSTVYNIRLQLTK